MIFIFSTESTPRGRGRERGRGRRLAKDEDRKGWRRVVQGEGERGRGWLLLLVVVVVVGRASKAVVQTSGTMEATLDSNPIAEGVGRRFCCCYCCCHWCWYWSWCRCWCAQHRRRMVITRRLLRYRREDGMWGGGQRDGDGGEGWIPLWIFLIPAHVTL